MNILFEIADKDLLVIGLAFIALIIFGVVVFHVVTKNNRVMPISEDDRFDNDLEEVEDKELTEEQLEAKSELEKVFNQMSKDLEEKEDRTIENFEREQEENAIISYQELIKQAKAKNLIEETEQKEEPKESYQQTLDLEEPEEEPKKFKNSEIISPIFGIQTGQAGQPQGKHVHKEDNNEFLNSLKEFRNSL